MRAAVAALVLDDPAPEGDLADQVLLGVDAALEPARDSHVPGKSSASAR